MSKTSRMSGLLSHNFSIATGAILGAIGMATAILTEQNLGINFNRDTATQAIEFSLIGGLSSTILSNYVDYYSNAKAKFKFGTLLASSLATATLIFSVASDNVGNNTEISTPQEDMTYNIKAIEDNRNAVLPELK